MKATFKKLLVFGLLFSSWFSQLGICSDKAINNSADWLKLEIKSYGVTIQRPSSAKVGDIFGLPGLTTIDGMLEAHCDLGMRPKYSRHYYGGVFYNFCVRAILLTDAAQLDPLIAKRNGWTTRPRVDFYPFEYQRDKDELLTSVARFYLEVMMQPDQVRPISVDGKNGVWISGWDYRTKKNKFFHEVVALPLSSKKVLLLQAAYYDVSGKKLEAERDVFRRIVNTAVVKNTE